jgi:hypothetical protein
MKKLFNHSLLFVSIPLEQGLYNIMEDECLLSIVFLKKHNYLSRDRTTRIRLLFNVKKGSTPRWLLVSLYIIHKGSIDQKYILYLLDSLYILGPTIWLLLKYRNNTILVPTTKQASDTCSMPRTVLHPVDCWSTWSSYTKVALIKSIYYIF